MSEVIEAGEARRRVEAMDSQRLQRLLTHFTLECARVRGVTNVEAALEGLSEGLRDLPVLARAVERASDDPEFELPVAAHVEFHPFDSVIARGQALRHAGLGVEPVPC